jgi:hypothetical protein
MRKRAFIIIGIILLSMLHSFAMAQSQSITTGIGWLTSSQTATGNWLEVNTSEYHSTTTALDAVYLLDPTNPSYATGFSWMTGQVVSPTDYLSRRIIVLKRAGADATAELDALLLYRNTDGGWGGETTYLSDALDTALALRCTCYISRFYHSHNVSLNSSTFSRRSYNYIWCFNYRIRYGNRSCHSISNIDIN